MTGTVTISIDERTKNKLNQFAQSLGLSRSGLLRMLVLQRIKQEEKQRGY